MPRILEPTPAAIAEAAAALRNRDVVAFPTETVYGLGADTFNEQALRTVYDLKGRPMDNPLIAHVLNVQQAKRVAAGWDARCDELARQFWPGPLTLVVKRSERVPRIATAGYSTIAVRCPSHPAAMALLEAFAGPISAPSANRSGRVSPTSPQHVADDFSDVPDLLILDGGLCDVGIESTVLDMMQATPMVLRPGSVSADNLSETLGAPVRTLSMRTQAASPGTSAAHYAPRTPLELVPRDQIEARLAASRKRLVILALHDIAVSPQHELIHMPGRAEDYAARLYDVLRQADAMNCSRILVEQPSEPGGVWDAIRNRLERATHD